MSGVNHLFVGLSTYLRGSGLNFISGVKINVRNLFQGLKKKKKKKFGQKFQHISGVKKNMVITYFRG
jgi:hypothetical protein